MNIFKKIRREKLEKRKEELIKQRDDSFITADKLMFHLFLFGTYNNFNKKDKIYNRKYITLNEFYLLIRLLEHRGIVVHLERNFEKSFHSFYDINYNDSTIYAKYPFSIFIKRFGKVYPIIPELLDEIRDIEIEIIEFRKGIDNNILKKKKVIN